MLRRLHSEVGAAVVSAFIPVSRAERLIAGAAASPATA
jgi:hypothetical protein